VIQALPAAVLWDMDGTLIDTEPYWLSAEIELVSSFGGTWTHEDGLTLVGSGLEHSAGILRGRGVDMPLQDIVQNLTGSVLARVQDEMPWRPGARELLQELKDAGVPMALVTMSIRRLADYVVSTLPFAAFDAVVAGDDVTHSKPHPEPYLRGAELLGVDIEHCIAIEDSRTGLASAIASGAISIGIPLHLPLEAGPGHTIWPSLGGKTVDDLSRLYNASLEVAS
jgi:HAD superfamily hydrolase (TIGR01509 family)